MKILGMGLPELLIILAVALLIFGPKNLPKLGSALGKTVRNLREGMGEGSKAEEAVEEEVEEIEEEVKEAEKKPAEKKTGAAPKKTGSKK
ncbi:MAG: twin-arginine translocase TatA/TatE family subunit [Eggerthellaceae bacterium]|nr:twin-arginine translocase TatA/TatE family subunit [Eggerthellaceae bacterium]